MWQAYRDKHGIETGSVKFKSNVCISVLVILLSLSISFTLYVSVVNFKVNNMFSMISSTMNAIAGVYLISAWLVSSGFMLLIAKLLADEYHLIYRQIQETSEGTPHLLNQRFCDICRQYWELSKIIAKTDDIFCAHVGVSVLFSLGLSCIELHNYLGQINSG